MKSNDRPSKFPPAKDTAKVGTYPADAKSGGGYFYDDILEYRVWVHPIDDQVCFWAFPTYEEAFAFSKNTARAEKPLVLVRQQEHINEPQPGEYIHIKESRITEWQVEWLEGSKNTKRQIPIFLATHKTT